MVEFDIAIKYKPGRVNVEAYALRRKVKLTNAMQLEGGQASQLQSNFLSRIKDGLYSDP